MVKKLTKVQLESVNRSFNDIVANGKSYSVPPFQRDYSWEQEQLNDLWQDVCAIEESKAQHFMGYLVLQDKTMIVKNL